MSATEQEITDIPPALLHVHIEPSRGWVALNLGDLWKYRELLYFLVWRDIKVRYKQTLLGAAWAVLQPVLTMIVFSVFFGRLAQMPSDGLPYPLFAYSALLPWQLFAFALSESSNSLVANQRLITKVYFPRLVVPIAAVLAGTVDFAIAFVVLLGMMVFYGVYPTLAVLLLPLFLILVLATALAVGLWLSALNVQYRDVRYMIPFLTQFWLFLTPIAYPSSLVPEWLRPLYALNPMVGVVEGFRWALLGTQNNAGALVFVSALMVALLLVGGLLYFRRMEKTFADLVEAMSDLAIQVQKLGKQYRIGQGAPSYRSLRDELMQAVKAPARALRSRARRQAGGGRSRQEHIWALKDISFEIRHGEVVGIIGRNGAGKSTLLKILSRITDPTEGVIDLYGRIGSLLEVGTGFHPELTGRENIYLNGAILGMRRVEIERKFDEIVAFAEMEKFIDTPVKFYSSGMYMRLAFSVAVHLEPEILLVDEVLAVGDANFQKKCLGKMGDVAGQGRTVLFVSHQMNAIRELCPRCLWLDRGGLVEDGETRGVVARYLGSGASNSEWVAAEQHSAVKNPYFNPTRFCIVNSALQTIQTTVQADETVGVLVEGDAQASNIALTVGFAVYASSGDLLFWSLHTDVRQEDWPPVRPGRNRLVAWLPPHFLNEGDYRVELILSLHFQEWLSKPGVNAPALALSIRGGLSQSPYWMMARPGLLAPVIPFQVIED